MNEGSSGSRKLGSAVSLDVGDTDCVLVGLEDADGVSVIVAEGLKDVVAVTEGLKDPVGVPVAVTEGLKDTVAVTDGLGTAPYISRIYDT